LKKVLPAGSRAPVASRWFFLYGYGNILAVSRDFELAPRAWLGAPNNRGVFNLIFPGKKPPHESIEPATIHG
jgi:hypothetical protein